jgi:aspartate dehydrogenase
MPRAGLIGYGAVGQEVCALVAGGAAGDASIVGILVRDPSKYGEEARRLGVPFLDRADDLLALGPDVVVEAGGHDALRAHVATILSAGIDVLSLSVGALADPSIHEAIEDAARRGGARLRVVSGAIAGLDAISSAAVGPIDRVRHTVRKPPATLLPEEEAAAVVESGESRELFSGTAREAALRFPANVNVVAAVSLAGIGLDRTEARVLADPSVVRNTHDVEVEGAFGRLRLTMENTPSDNPKTGRIVALSVARALRAYSEAIVVGA